MTAIFDWNCQKGFGFVTYEGQKHFVHVSSFDVYHESLRGDDFNGREIEVVRTSIGAKGPKVETATLVPLVISWHQSVGDLYRFDQLFQGKDPSRSQVYKVVEYDYDSKTEPRLDVELLAQVSLSGCPDELIAKIFEFYEDVLNKWHRSNTLRNDFESAQAAAREFLSVVPPDQVIVILPVERPQPTQWLHEKAIESFNSQWEIFTKGVIPLGKNDHYLWYSQCANFDRKPISAHYSHSSMEWVFDEFGIVFSKEDRWKKRVFKGLLICGENSPHRKYKED